MKTTNQASEDELRDAILTEFKQVYKLAGSGDYTENCTNVVMSIVRNEKLKLLAEVRERVVGENQHSEHKEWDCPCGATHSFTEEWHATNRLRDEQRTALAKLEAEL